MFGLGVPEILIIALILLFIFGAKRLPGIGAGLGQTLKEIRNVKKEISASGKPAEKGEEGQGEAQETEDSSAETKSLGGTLADSLGKKVTDKVVGQVPGIKQAKQLKDTADKVKKFIG